MKALQIYRELKAIHSDTVLITHERNEKELHERLGLSEVMLVRDDAIALTLWKSVVLRPLLDYWFCAKAIAHAKRFVAERGLRASDVVIFQAEPNSPVLPRIVAEGYVNVFGPVNGNIYYPKLFRQNEAFWPKLRRILHFPLQRMNRMKPGGIKRADLILTAGGKRTRDSLLAAGCPERILLDSHDCGISDPILDRPRIEHAGRNLRFIHFGRLVFHKGTALVIESLAKTRQPIRLDIVGVGPELAHCRQVVERLNLGDRVTFMTPYRDQRDLFDSLADYRGMVLPSIEDANGMVVQEAMAMGLPPVCLDWGGPQLLVDDGQNGFLVAPESREQITARIAECLDALAENPTLAERFSVAGRRKAGEWRWSQVAAGWLAAFERIGRKAPARA